MAVYADYTYYTEQFRGTAIAQSDFDRLAMRASVLIDQVTFDRAEAVVAASTDTDTVDKIKMATCAVAEMLNKDESEGGEIQSERVGNYSVTYVKGAARSLLIRARDEAKPYLWDTYLMYGGPNLT